ncbi:hypothetical protein NL676_008245 [Syzygium grande]|nr:hypothetical protein NL676_008245 [Syzygium grande]
MAEIDANPMHGFEPAGKSTQNLSKDITAAPAPGNVAVEQSRNLLADPLAGPNCSRSRGRSKFRSRSIRRGQFIASSSCQPSAKGIGVWADW